MAWGCLTRPYDAYGKQTVKNGAGAALVKSAVGFDRGFAGYIADQETGMPYARTRMYSPYMGRYVGRDQVRLSSRMPTAHDGYKDGYDLYEACFVPNHLDANGTTKCEQLALAGYKKYIYATMNLGEGKCSKLFPASMPAVIKKVAEADKWMKDTYATLCAKGTCECPPGKSATDYVTECVPASYSIATVSKPIDVHLTRAHMNEINLKNGGNGHLWDGAPEEWDECQVDIVIDATATCGCKTSLPGDAR